jgi:non-ribosomal peptide synthetase component F
MQKFILYSGPNWIGENMALEAADRPLQDSDVFFCEAAQSTPDRVALSDSIRSTTWIELDRRANQIARKLIANGVNRPTPWATWR